MRKLFLISVLFFGTQVDAFPIKMSDTAIEQLKLHAAAQKMKDAASRYIQFINRLASGEQFDHQESANKLLRHDCKKIFNGALVTSDSKAFVDDLLTLHATYGSWKLTPADIIISTESSTAAVRLFVDIPALGKFTEIVLMRFDEDFSIFELNIVFSKVQDGYEFE